MDRQVQQEINEIIKELKTHFQSEHNQMMSHYINLVMIRI